MIIDPDIWRAANLLVKQHGLDAAFVAAQRADDLLEQGDIEGERIWKQIVEAVRELQRTAPSGGEKIN